MVRIQKLKQPKVNSGKEIKPGTSIEIKGLTIKNNNKFSLWADTFARKVYKPKTKGVKK